MFLLLGAVNYFFVHVFDNIYIKAYFFVTRVSLKTAVMGRKM